MRWVEGEPEAGKGWNTGTGFDMHGVSSFTAKCIAVYDSSDRKTSSPMLLVFALASAGKVKSLFPVSVAPEIARG